MREYCIRDTTQCLKDTPAYCITRLSLCEHSKLISTFYDVFCCEIHIIISQLLNRLLKEQVCCANCMRKVGVLHPNIISQNLQFV